MSEDTALTGVLETLDNDVDAAIERLFTLLRTRSISTDPAYADECRKAADIVAADLADIGFAASIRDTQGHPIVFAEHDGPGPHVLFYGHYDVQPVDPLNLWHRDPFDPAILDRDDGTRYITGRGTGDDKGQFMTFVEACRAWKATTGALPCKVTILIEGEEESGGKSLPPFLDANRDLLAAADVALVCDTAMWNAKTPAITTSLRGTMAMEMTISAANKDLHSGYYGGAAQNPIRILSSVLADLHDDHGRVTVPGFYDGVHEVPDQVRAQWDQLGFTAEGFLGPVGLKHSTGEIEFGLADHVWSRPTCEINGIWGGYTGTGFKTVIPAEAHAKISCRLVGDQDPDAINAALKAFISERIPADCSVTFHDHGRGPAISMPVGSATYAKALDALSTEWETQAVFIGGGGSIPVVGEFKARLGLDSLLIGFGLDDDAIHSPNEKYELTSFTKGARSWARILDALGSGD